MLGGCAYTWRLCRCMEGVLIQIITPIPILVLTTAPIMQQQSVITCVSLVVTVTRHLAPAVNVDSHIGRVFRLRAPTVTSTYAGHV